MITSPRSETLLYIEIWRTNWEDHKKVTSLAEIWFGYTQGTEIILLKKSAIQKDDEFSVFKLSWN